MLEKWQFNVLFFVGVFGAVLLLVGPELGLDINTSPTATTGVGAILAYVLTQKKSITKKNPPDEPDEKADDESRKEDE